MKQVAVVFTSLLLCSLAVADDVSAQEPGLSSGLIRSAASMLDSADDGDVEFALRLLNVLAGIEDLDEYRRAAVADAVEAAQVLSLLDPLSDRQDSIGTMARQVGGRLRSRLGFDAASNAVEVATYDFDEKPEPLPTITIEPPNETFRWIRFAAFADEGHLLRFDGCDYTTVSVFRSDMQKIAEREFVNYSGSLVVPPIESDEQLLARFRSTGYCDDRATVNVARGYEASAVLPLTVRRADAPEIQPGSPYAIRISDFDQHWARFRAEVGTLYIIRTSDLQDGADSVLELLNADGEYIDSNDDFDGLASRLQFTPAESGDYYLGLEDLSASDGEFTLIVEANDSLANATKIDGGVFREEATPIPEEGGTFQVEVAPYSFAYLSFDVARGVVVRLRSSVGLAIIGPGDAGTWSPQSGGQPGGSMLMLQDGYFVALESGRHIVQLDVYSEQIAYLEITKNPFGETGRR